MATTTTALAGVAPSLIANPDLCTLDTCPLSLANITYVPTLPGNALYAGLFVIIVAIQVFLGFRHRTWGFLGGICGGILLEIVGYIARIQMHYNPFTQGPFLMYLVCLTIAPAFLSASIYLCLSRIVIIYSANISLFKPKTYTLLFMGCDFVALILQAAGGAIASIANTQSSKQTGIHIMVAGVSWQVFSLSLFAVLCVEFSRRVQRTPDSKLDERFIRTRSSTTFQLFLWALGIATLTVFVRSVFRCAELSGGFDGPLANQQTTFMILEGAMIIIAVTSLTIFHPGVGFCGQWHEAAWKLRKGKQDAGFELSRGSQNGQRWPWSRGAGGSYVPVEQPEPLLMRTEEYGGA